MISDSDVNFSAEAKIWWLNWMIIIAEEHGEKLWINFFLFLNDVNW